LNSKLSEFQNENAGLLARISSLETQLEAEVTRQPKSLVYSRTLKANCPTRSKRCRPTRSTQTVKTFSASQERRWPFPEGAKGDLDTRQKAIGELVQPLRESLDKVDSKIRELDQRARRLIRRSRSK